MLDIEYAFLADAADARPGHKSPSSAAACPPSAGRASRCGTRILTMVGGLLVRSPELGTEHDLRFVLLTPDIASLDLWTLAFPVPGKYSLPIVVDGNDRKRSPDSRLQWTE